VLATDAASERSGSVQAAAPTVAPAADGESDRSLRWVLRSVWALLGLQLLGLIFVSGRLYRNYHLGRDFSVYSQAWWLMAHGHLNPYSSMSALPFLKNHFELIMWFLAPLYWLNHSPFDLLLVQDVALVLAEVVVVLWALDVVRRHPGRGIPIVPTVAGVAVLLLVNPFFYATAFDDFHSESIAILFAVLAGRDLYNRRDWRALIWTGCLLLCGDVAAVYILALGLSATVANRRLRPIGPVLVLVGVAWLEIVSAIGANAGAGLGQRYAYLTDGLKPGQQATVWWIINGILHHPNRPLAVIRERWALMIDVLRPGGIIGVASPWAIFIAVLTVVPNALIPGVLFIEIGFQNVIVTLFTLVGSVMVLDWLARRGPAPDHARPPRARVVACALAVAAFVSSLVYGLPGIHHTYTARLTISPPAVAMLQAASKKIPPDAQVLASSIVMGRYADRDYLSQVWTDQAQYQVVPGVPVVFVLVRPLAQPDPTVDPEASAQGIAADVDGLLRNPHVRVLGRSAGGVVLEWTPPPGAAVVSLPPRGPELTR
jgi:hypothetical protein